MKVPFVCSTCRRYEEGYDVMMHYTQQGSNCPYANYEYNQPFFRNRQRPTGWHSVHTGSLWAEGLTMVT